MNDENINENADEERDPPGTDEEDEAVASKDSVAGAAPLTSRESDDEDGSALPTQLGAARYVLAGFFAAGIAVAFIVSRSLTAGWNRLADNPWVSQHAAFLNRIAEDDRSTYTMLVGAVAGVCAAVYAYRRDDVRTWTGEVGTELSKVSWPSKKEVTNSTVVVILTGAFATVYLALLDRFWGFVTSLVYGS
jgi:preprotein translocase subunit SecE